MLNTQEQVMKVINLFGGPGVGKSTTASGLFYEMKKARLEVELVTEYAKDAVWEGRTSLLDDQIYIFAKQQRRISRLAAHGVKWVITDSPVALGLIYLKDGALSDNFNNLVMEVFNHWDNHNFLLQRNFAYTPIGRNQKDETEAKLFDQRLNRLFQTYNIPYDVITGGEYAVAEIMKNIVLDNSCEPI